MRFPNPLIPGFNPDPSVVLAWFDPRRGLGQ